MERLLPLTPVLCLVLATCVIAQFWLLAGLNARFARQSKMVRHFFSGPQGEDLEALLNRNFDQTQMALDNSQIALERVQMDADRLDACVQHFALERYDAFEDMHGQQSFSVALIDGRGNGTVITSLQNRQGTRCYGKSVVNGEAQQSLSTEEQQVLVEALKTKRERRPALHLAVPAVKTPAPVPSQQELRNAA